MPPPSTKRVISILNQMESEQVIEPYAIGGAIAAFMYIEAAFTADIDIFVTMQEASLDPLGPILDWLRGRGYGEFQGEGVLIAGWAVQFIPASTRLQKDALAHAVHIDFEEVRTRIFTPEHLMALCLDLGRPKDRARLATFLSGKSYDEEFFLELVERFDLGAKWATFKSAHL